MNRKQLLNVSSISLWSDENVWNETLNILNAIEFSTLKWSILYPVTFTSIKKNFAIKQRFYFMSFKNVIWKF